MKLALLSAAFVSVSITPALAQQAAPAPAAAPTAPAAAPGALNGDSPIETIAASPAGKAAMEKNLPGVLDHPAYEQFKGMSLRALAPMSGGIITDEKIAAVEAELKAAKK